MIDEHGHFRLRGAEHLDPVWRLWDALPAQWRGPVLGPGIENWASVTENAWPHLDLSGPSADSFAMMRGGHLDVCALGAFQVSWHGDLANWHTGAPDAIFAVGGAMDLAIGAKRVLVMMNLFAKDGTAKLFATAPIR